jgi:hypothetical protein
MPSNGRRVVQEGQLLEEFLFRQELNWVPVRAELTGSFQGGRARPLAISAPDRFASNDDRGTSGRIPKKLSSHGADQFGQLGVGHGEQAAGRANSLALEIAAVSLFERLLAQRADFLVISALLQVDRRIGFPFPNRLADRRYESPSSG